MTGNYSHHLSFQGGIRMLFLVLGLIVASQLSAEESLISNPPFKRIDRELNRPSNQKFSTQGSINQRFELAGIFNLAGNLKFSINDKQTNKPLWLRLGESIDGVRVESYNAQEFGIVMNQSGVKELLILREMKKNSNVRGSIPSYNTISAIQDYPRPPPSLPRPNRLLEELRRKKE